MDSVTETLSQQEYQSQVETFLNHLVKAIPDDTFPIWMLTTMENPEQPSTCHNPTLPKSSEHPCNLALKELFKNSPFPSRVQLLDNTDLSLPQLGDNKTDIAAVVALRLYVVIGKKVQEPNCNSSIHRMESIGFDLLI